MILLFWQIFSWDRAIKLLVCLLVCERLQKFIVLISDCEIKYSPSLGGGEQEVLTRKKDFHLAGGQSVFQELSGTKFITVLPI